MQVQARQAARKHQKKILVVTNDGDWKSYCSESELLVAIDDLAVALGCFQEESVTYFCRVIEEKLRRGWQELVDSVELEVRNQEDAIEIDVVDADSQFHCEEEGAYARIRSIEIQQDEDRPILEPIRYENGQLIVRLVVSVDVDIVAHFSFKKWDGIDKEYMPMGSGEAKTSENISTEIFITLSGKLPDSPFIEEIEVSPLHLSMSFYDLEPDWMNDSSNFND